LRKDLLIGLDIGTTKVCALIAKIKENKFEIIGIGKSFSQGLSKGMIVNIEEASRGIEKAVKEAEFDAGFKISQVWASIAGNHIQGMDNSGFFNISSEDKIITHKDVEKALENASRLTLPPNREIIHTLPQEFTIDGQSGIKRPIGMSGTYLGVKVYIVTASSTYRQNIENSVKNGGYGVEGVVLQSLASGMATLSPEEEDMGVALIDIGGGTTDVAIFLEDGIRFSCALGVGGNHITNDIAVGLHTTRTNAEKIKIKYGSTSMSPSCEGEAIEIKGVMGRRTYKVKGEDLIKIIDMRVGEIFELVDRELEKSGYKDLITSGIVLTGGCSLLRGIKEKAEEKIGLPVRIGYPRLKNLDTLNSPIYATAVGLILYGMKERKKVSSKNTLEVRIKEWIKDFF